MLRNVIMIKKILFITFGFKSLYIKCIKLQAKKERFLYFYSSLTLKLMNMKNLYFILFVTLFSCTKKDDSVNFYKYDLSNKSGYKVTITSPDNSKKFIINTKSDTTINAPGEIWKYSVKPEFNPDDYNFFIYYNMQNKVYDINRYTYELEYSVSGDSASIIKYLDYKGDTITKENRKLPYIIYYKNFDKTKFYLSAKSATNNEILVAIRYKLVKRSINNIPDKNGFVTLIKNRPSDYDNSDF